MQQVPLGEVTLPIRIPDETARPFQVALQDVVRSSAISMADLRESVKACTRSLRDSSVGPAQMIISIKACARDCNKQHMLNEMRGSSNADFLMDIIVKWAIVEYYRDA